MKTSLDWLKSQLENFGNPNSLEIEWEILDYMFESAKTLNQIELKKSFNRGKKARSYEKK